MSKSNRGVVIVVAGGVLLGVVFVLVYATVIEPSARLTKAQKEIQTWGDAWTAARTCLLGDEPRSTDPTEAYVARELLEAGVVGAVRECLEPLKKLRRKEGDSSGTHAVEVAWSDMKSAIGKVGKAHALRAAKDELAPPATLRAKLGSGIVAMDEAYNHLRAAAEMKPAEPAGAGRLTPTGKLVTLADNVTGGLIRSNVVTVSGELADGDEADPDTVLPGYIARITRIDPPKEAFRPQQPLAVTGDRGPLWGVWLDPGDGARTGDGLLAGAVDDTGAPAGRGVEVVRVAPGAAVSAMYATGDGDSRVVVYRVQSARLGAQIRVARSADAGAAWSEEFTFPADAHLSRTESLARADVTWIEGGRLQWLAIAGGRVDSFRPIDVAPEALLGYGQSTEQCFGESATWWLLERAVIYVGADGKAAAVPGGTSARNIVLCDDRHMVEVHSIAKGDALALKLSLCTPTSCDRSLELPLARDASVLAAMGPALGTSIAVTSNGVIAVWSGNTADGKPPAHRGVYALPDGFDPYGLVEWSGQLYAVGLADGVASATALGSPAAE